ncbi:hypothetical protein BGZ68_002421 [Mortierella alpina]|nr:hypothetical protein BGZ68_002421 [Mortierella alpina]
MPGSDGFLPIEDELAKVVQSIEAKNSYAEQELSKLSDTTEIPHSATDDTVDQTLRYRNLWLNTPPAR